MKKTTLLFTLLALLSVTFIHAQEREGRPIEMAYDVSFNNPEDTYVEVRLNCKNLPDTLTHLCLPAWAPGYYLILNSATHVVDFAATDEQGRTLPVVKSEKSRWSVSNGAARNITVTYRVYANRQSVAQANVTSEAAFLPGNEIFMYIQGCTNLPCTITLHPYKGWKCVAGSLPRMGSEGYSYRAQDFDQLYDSPFYLGNQKMFDFTFEGKGYTMSVAHSEGMDSALLVDDMKKAIHQATLLMQDVPYDHYTFILMGPGGGGLEHCNSQADFFSAQSYNREDDRQSLLCFLTHEYFHLYNVKRIRPIELGPFDYSRENYTGLLWFSEGATCYYEYVLLSRAGLLKSSDFLKEFEENLRTVENGSGHLHMSLDRSSRDIWLNFFIEDRNGTQISYYNKGPLVTLLMDIALRNATGNKASLDDLMRLLYNRYYKELGRGFTDAEFWSAAAQVSGHADLSEIQSYVYTTCEVDYAKYLKMAGIEVDLTPQSKQDVTGVVQRSWKLSLTPHPNAMQQAIRNGIMGGVQ